jgi:hypothetical protein
MADYYNKTKGPVAVALLRGGSVLIGPKKWLTIDPLDEGHESLQRSLTRGDIIRKVTPVEAPPVQAAPPAPVAPVAPVVVAEPVVQAAPPAETKPNVSFTAPVVRSGKKGR